MLDTLIVAVVLCVDTCTWGFKEKFDYADLHFSLRESIQRGVMEVQGNRYPKRAFLWHVKETILFRKEEAQ